MALRNSAIFWLSVSAIIALVMTGMFSMNTFLSRDHRSLHPTGTIDFKTDCNGATYYSLKQKYEEEGGVVFRSCSMLANPKRLDGAEAYTKAISTSRETNAYSKNSLILDIAVDEDTLEFIAYLNNKKAFPFQTLNFPWATQQEIHSDLIHFDTLPTRGLMTASWVALEDIHADSGPLEWYPGSHKYGNWDLEELGTRAEYYNNLDNAEKDHVIAANHFLMQLQAKIKELNLKPAYATMPRGSSFIWAASLLHGGSKWNDKSYTRRSQVTHYWLEGAETYWVPRKSIRNAGKIAYKCNQPVCTVSSHTDCAAKMIDWFKKGRFMEVPKELAGET